MELKNMAIEDKQKKRFRIKILGQEMVIVGNLSEEYVNHLSNHINVIGEEICRAYPRLSHQRIMNLVVMNITDEYYKLKNVYNNKIKELKELEKENQLLKEKYEEIKNEYNELLELLEEDD
ncbi:MAG: cell division protein ZapA [Halanaerobiales bacterium]|jgi:cell division protein ZapA